MTNHPALATAAEVEAIANCGCRGECPEHNPNTPQPARDAPNEPDEDDANH